MIIKRHIFETYLAVINGSLGTKMFQHFYATFDKEKRDALNAGELSCAFYVSSILSIFNLIKKPSSTVSSVVVNLEEAGWLIVESPEAGDVIVYEATSFEGMDQPIPYIGFYTGDEKAISHSTYERVPVEHDWLFRTSKPRKVSTIYRGRHLMPDDIKTVDN